MGAHLLRFDAFYAEKAVATTASLSAFLCGVLLSPSCLIFGRFESLKLKSPKGKRETKRDKDKEPLKNNKARDNKIIYKCVCITKLSLVLDFTTLCSLK